MSPEYDPTYPTKPILALLLCAALVALAVGVFGIDGVRGELKTGKAYSLAVVFGDSDMISRVSSPTTTGLA